MSSGSWARAAGASVLVLEAAPELLRGAAEPVGDARGVLPCPFDDGVFHKNSVTVERAGFRIVYSDLSIHMLERHHFCQGVGSDFRLDPVVLKHVLE